MTADDEKMLEALASGIPDGKKSTSLTREALLLLLKEAYEIGYGTGLAFGIADGFSIGRGS